MPGYGQYCPVAKGAEVFAERWMPLVLRELLCGSTHFNDLHRGVPLMSRSLLSQRLRRLEKIGALVRKQGPRGPEYHLTEAGRDFAPIVRLLGEWGQRWFRSNFTRDELDVGLLMWDISHGVKTDAFAPGRTAIQFDFPDQPRSKRTWWLVCADGQLELCPTDPGFDVDLYLSTDVQTLARVWMGDLSAAAAIRSDAIRLSGQRELCRRLERWLGLSSFAGISDARRTLLRQAKPMRAPMAERVVQIRN
jgi:DNA-binding HxlR family transcriptional regulator